MQHELLEKGEKSQKGIGRSVDCIGAKRDGKVFVGPQDLRMNETLMKKREALMKTLRGKNEHNFSANFEIIFYFIL